MASDNFFDPMPETPFTPSANLPADDPLRDWAAQLQDPKLMELMASDPRAAIERMKELGVPPPPPEISRYAEGGLGTEQTRTMAVPTQVVGGAPAAPAPSPYKSFQDLGATAGGVYPDGSRPDPTAAQGPFRLDRGAPPPSAPGPAAATAAPSAGGFLDPEAEENPSPVAAGTVPVPRSDPRKPTEMSSQNRIVDGLDSFSKSLAGVKAPAPPPANFVSTPSAPRPNQIQAPQLQQLLTLAGATTPNPLALTLGRLLATGKA